MARRRKQAVPSDGGGSLLVDTLTLPILGVPRLVYWFAKKIAEAAEQEAFDEGRLQGELMDLQMRYELGEVSEEEFSQKEAILLEKLNAIREAKAG